MKRYSLSYLKSLKTIGQGQTDDLKIDRDGTRVWLSRMTREDGVPYDNMVTIEKYNGQRWVVINEYPAKK